MSETHNASWLIDAIVQQTLILTAHIATAGGQRAPVAQLADQVFRDLAAQLEAQGLSQKVVADMFGMALRSYQRKRRRSLESVTHSGRSLWASILRFVTEEGPVTRQSVLAHFARDAEVMVGGVLSDLVASSLLSQSGYGPQTIYRPVALEVEDWTREQSDEVAQNLLWNLIYRRGPVDLETMCSLVPLTPSHIEAMLERLLEEGRISRAGDPAHYASSAWLIPYGSVDGWPAAVFDHFQAIVGALCAKLRGEARAELHDAIGGSTFRLVVAPGHPFEQEALGLLAEFRERASALRQRIDRYNEKHPIEAPPTQVVLYLGQNVIMEEG